MKLDNNKMGVLQNCLCCVIMATLVNCDPEIDSSCVINGMYVPGCNGDMSDEMKAEIAKEKEEIKKEKEEKEKNMTEEEREAEKKKIYKKLFFTNDYDWIIRDELDAADDVIQPDVEKAIDLFEDILKRYPESPRAKYALCRSKVTV